MTLPKTLSNPIKIDSPKINVTELVQKSPQLIIWSLLGAVAGALSVALVTGMVILAELFLFSTLTLAPGGLIITLAASGLSCGTAWLGHRLAAWLWPQLLPQTDPQGLKTVLVVALLTCLLESLLFGAGL